MATGRQFRRLARRSNDPKARAELDAQIEESLRTGLSPCGCVSTPGWKDRKLIKACAKHAPATPGTPEFAALHPPPSSYQVGEAVQIYSFGRYYPGIVAKIARTRLTVAYKAGGGKFYERAVSSDLVKKA